jgi:glycosyltransferase involved in cell wall biosynthesis
VARALIIAYTTYVHDGRVKRHAEALAARGDHVDVICLDPAGELNGVNILGLDIPRYRGASRSSYIGNYIRFFARATTLAARMNMADKYDLVIACTMPDAVVICTLPLRLMGAKVILDVHDTMPELYRDKFGGRRGALGARLLMIEERLSAALAHRVFAVHEPHRQRLVKSGIQAEKIRVVMNSPDSRIFRSEDIRNHCDGDFTVICHGTLARRLGLDVAIKAVALLRDRVPELKLRIVGDGDYRAQAVAMVNALKLEDRVSFMDAVPIEELPALLQEAAVGLVPNRASSATHLMLPVKLLEYASLGIPSIVPRLRTIESYFDDQAVRFFEPNDEVSLAQAIEDLYHDPQLRLSMALRGHATACRMSWTGQRHLLLDAVDSLLANGSNGGHDAPAAEARVDHRAPERLAPNHHITGDRSWRRE